MHYYLIQPDGGQAGPYSLAQLKTFWANGTVTMSTLYWTEGMSQWLPIRTLESALRPVASTDIFTEPLPAESLPSHEVKKNRIGRTWVVLPSAFLLVGLSLALFYEASPHRGLPDKSRSAVEPKAVDTTDVKATLETLLKEHPDVLPFQAQVNQQILEVHSETGSPVALKKGDGVRILSYSSGKLRALTSDDVLVALPVEATNVVDIASQSLKNIDPTTLIGSWSGTSNSHVESKNEYLGYGHFFVTMTTTLKFQFSPDHTFTSEIDSSNVANTMDIRSVKKDDSKSRGKGTWTLGNSGALSCTLTTFETLKNGQWQADQDLKGGEVETYKLIVNEDTIQSIEYPMPEFDPHYHLDDKDPTNTGMITANLQLNREDLSGIILSNKELRRENNLFRSLVLQTDVAEKESQSKIVLYSHTTEDQMAKAFQGLDWGDFKIEGPVTVDRIKTILSSGKEKVPTALGQRAHFIFSQEEGMLLKTIMKLSDQKNAAYQNLLGIVYANGIGVAKEMSKALMCFQQSAEAGNSHAEENLGLLFKDGTDVDKDYGQALIWFKKAADQGNPYAENELGSMYQNGLGVAKDYSQALSWFQKSADLGNSRAECNLGYMYQSAFGVPQDYAQALKWYQKAATQDDSMAENNLGCLYFDGHGSPVDFNRAFYWFQKAAYLGNADGESNLAVMYRDGKSVPPDAKIALEWFQKAAARGNSVAKAKVGEMEDASEASTQ